MDKEDEGSPVAYLAPTSTPTNGSKFSNDRNERKTKSRKKISQQKDDQQPPSLPSPSKREIFTCQRAKKKGPFTPSLNSDTEYTPQRVKKGRARTSPKRLYVVCLILIQVLLNLNYLMN